MNIKNVGALQIPKEVQNSNPNVDRRNPDVLNAARMYENQFLREMVRAMRQTVPESEFMPASQGEKIFKQQLDDNIVDDWVDRGGIGLSDVIYEQVMERYFGAQQARSLPRGPVPIQPGESQVTPLRAKSGDVTLKLNALGNKELTAPWSGRVLGVNDIGHGQKSILIEHNDEKSHLLGDKTGHLSSLVFYGQALVAPESNIGAGQKIALLNAEQGPVIWRIQER